ncbi:MAG: hypothetical protein EA388_14505 [Nitriliruptor sp.]|nr:hypothetical protein [Intrasporangiaceae bacterium]TVR30304.1 MAG: hypothetical protein EA388_14505 [Nitriliruptor sp.]
MVKTPDERKRNRDGDVDGAGWLEQTASDMRSNFVDGGWWMSDRLARAYVISLTVFGGIVVGLFVWYLR